MKHLTAALMLSLACALSACGGASESPATPQDSAYFLPQDNIINIEGVQVRYRDEGPRDGRTIVMIHGFTSSLESWDVLTQDLTADFRLIRLDLPGHGLTGPDPQARYTNEETVLFLENFLRAIEVDSPILVGNSLGGLVAWRLAAKSPDMASQLVLLSPGGFSINGVAEDPIEVPILVKLYLTKAPEAGVKQATSALFADSSKLSDARVKQVRDMMLRPGNGDAFVARAASFTLPNPTADLASVQTPTLIIWGDNDIMVPVAQAEEFAAVMPNATVKI